MTSYSYELGRLVFDNEKQRFYFRFKFVLFTLKNLKGFFQLKMIFFEFINLVFFKR